MKSKASRLRYFLTLCFAVLFISNGFSQTSTLSLSKTVDGYTTSANGTEVVIQVTYQFKNSGPDTLYNITLVDDYSESYKRFGALTPL
ncbi:MAG: hypothetical protein LBU62_04610, partial [Bacteroidales bacterium]|nr:hypothetical protein [Bacteroidales bacterium]